MTSEIATGRAGAATISDVARAASVSTATVSRVLNGNYPVADRTREKVMGAVRELHYSANANARALASSDTHTVGVILDDVVDPTFSYIVRGVEEAVTRTDRLAIVAASRGNPERELQLIERMRDQRTDAVVVVGGASANEGIRRRMAAQARALNDMGSTLVLCGRPSLGAEVPTKLVGYDNEGGAFAITEHLISLGHRRIAYVGGPAQLSTTLARVNGYRRAFEARGLATDADLIRLGHFGPRFGNQQMRELLQSDLKFTAVFAGNDMVAVGAMDALTEAGLRVPEDISLVGYDDIPQAYDLQPKLTTVHVPLEDLGRQSVRIALPEEDFYERHEADHVTLGTHVVLRDSTGPPP